MKFTVAALVFVAAEFLTASAFARGGAPNIMDSPGYQRRLQESRGIVTNQSVLHPYTAPPAVYPGRKWRHRRHYH